MINANLNKLAFKNVTQIVVDPSLVLGINIGLKTNTQFMILVNSL